MKTFEEVKALMERIEPTNALFHLYVAETDTRKELCLTYHGKNGYDHAEFFFPPRNEEEREITEMGEELLDWWASRLKD